MNSRPILRVLHLASFSGNIGDNANHAGARAQFSRNLSFELHYTELEIREFYWKSRLFNEDFINYANQFDLLLIGGGNYFELWVEHSRTGCSIDLPQELLIKARCPVLFYGLGVDAGQGVPPECHQKFRTFLDFLLSSDQYLVAVRNDGAVATLETYFGKYYADAVISVPDGGFFIEPTPLLHSELRPFKRSVAVNLAGDMLDTRFSNNAGYISADIFFKTFAATLHQLISEYEDLHIVFVPHIFRDLVPIAQVIDYLPDSVRRRQIAVAPYLTGEAGANKLFDLYRQSHLVLAMRFHANVCALGMDRPTLGLSCYPQIDHLYRELEMPNSIIAVNRPHFAGELLTSSQGLLTAAPRVSSNIPLARLKADIQSAHKKIDLWLQRNFSTL